MTNPLDPDLGIQSYRELMSRPVYVWQLKGQRTYRHVLKCNSSHFLVIVADSEKLLRDAVTPESPKWFVALVTVENLMSSFPLEKFTGMGLRVYGVQLHYSTNKVVEVLKSEMDYRG